jgi:hypothetical protein
MEAVRGFLGTWPDLICLSWQLISGMKPGMVAERASTSKRCSLHRHQLGMSSFIPVHAFTRLSAVFLISIIGLLMQISLKFNFPALVLPIPCTSPLTFP